MRKCIFCGARATSLEHVWPLWLLKRVNRGHAHGTIKLWRDDSGNSNEWSGVDADLKVKYVCIPCNTGWMNALETANRAIIGAMVGDFAIPLDAASQQLIALWSAKTAMVVDCLKRGPWFYSQADRDGFLANVSPPAETLVWVGRYAHHVGILSEGRRLSNTEVTADSLLQEGHLTNLVFGRLILQILTVRRNPQFNRTRLILEQRLGVLWGKYLRQVWPIRHSSVPWPPPRSFSDAGETLDSLAKRFTKDS